MQGGAEGGSTPKEFWARESNLWEQGYWDRKKDARQSTPENTIATRIARGIVGLHRRESGRWGVPGGEKKGEGKV